MENQIFIIYRHFTNFFAKFCIISRKEISEKCENDTKFRAQTNFLSRIFSQNFRIYFPKNVHICYFAKFSVVLFRENFTFFLQNSFKRNLTKKTKIFAFFAGERNAKNCEIELTSTVPLMKKS